MTDKKISLKWLLWLSALMLSACMGVPDKVKVVDSVDARQYLGTWYEIARLDHSFERDLDYVTANYSLRDDGGIKVTNRGFNSKTKTWQEAVGKAYFVDPISADKTNTGKLKVSFFGPFYGAYNIMVLDKPYYTYPIKQHLIAQAQEMGFATEQLIHVKQSSEIIQYKAGPHVK